MEVIAVMLVRNARVVFESQVESHIGGQGVADDGDAGDVLLLRAAAAGAADLSPGRDTSAAAGRKVTARHPSISLQRQAVTA